MCTLQHCYVISAARYFLPWTLQKFLKQDSNFAIFYNLYETELPVEIFSEMVWEGETTKKEDNTLLALWIVTDEQTIKIILINRQYCGTKIN